MFSFVIILFSSSRTKSSILTNNAFIQLSSFSTSVQLVGIINLVGNNVINPYISSYGVCCVETLYIVLLAHNAISNITSQSFRLAFTNFELIFALTSYWLIMLHHFFEENKCWIYDV